MAPYIGEIRMFGGNFAPIGWTFCDGSLLPISENDALFTLIGTTYGGDGQETFAVPDLRGRLPVHMGTGAGVTYQLGENGGVEQVTLTTQQLPAHTHTLAATTNPGQQSSPIGLTLANTTGADIYSGDTPVAQMWNQAISSVGGSQPHDNMHPFVCISYIISLAGVFPSQS